MPQGGKHRLLRKAIEDLPNKEPQPEQKTPRCRWTTSTSSKNLCLPRAFRMPKMSHWTIAIDPPATIPCQHFLPPSSMPKQEVPLRRHSRRRRRNRNQPNSVRLQKVLWDIRAGTCYIRWWLGIQKILHQKMKR